MGPLAAKALVHASANVGQEEKPIGSNWGFPVEKWLATVGIHVPAAWCMSFVYGMFNEAAADLGITNPLVKTGGCLYAWENAASHRVTVPQPGDFFIMDFGGGEGHTGFVEAIEGDLSNPTAIHTIEGNSAPAGSTEAERREGFIVCRHVQTIPNKLIIGYLRY